MIRVAGRLGSMLAAQGAPAASASSPLILDTTRVDVERFTALSPKQRLAGACSVSAAFLAIIRIIGAESLDSYPERFRAEGLSSSFRTEVDRLALLAHLPAASFLTELNLYDAYKQLCAVHRGGGAAPQHVREANAFRRAMEQLAGNHVDAVRISLLLDIHFAPGTVLAANLCTVHSAAVCFSLSPSEASPSTRARPARAARACASLCMLPPGLLLGPAAAQIWPSRGLCPPHACRLRRSKNITCGK